MRRWYFEAQPKTQDRVTHWKRSHKKIHKCLLYQHTQFSVLTSTLDTTKVSIYTEYVEIGPLYI